MKKKFFLVIFFLLMGWSMIGKDKVEFFSGLSGEINGWIKSAPDTLYTKDNLYDYIDGGAELYLSYGFKKLWTRTYQKKDQPEIIVDIFNMGNSDNAYGVFSHSRETSSSVVGQESEYAGGLLIFWKGQYYISILAYPENDIARETVFKIGEKIDQLIVESGKPPAIISSLPSQGLVKDSIRYFRHYIWLNSHFYISDKNILHINSETEAVLARYKIDDSQFFLLLVSYQDINKSQKAYSDFIKNYFPDAKKGIGITENGKWAGAVLQNRKIWIILNADNQKIIQRMIDSFKSD